LGVFGLVVTTLRKATPPAPGEEFFKMLSA
jgi:hypothetical protein